MTCPCVSMHVPVSLHIFESDDDYATVAGTSAQHGTGMICLGASTFLLTFAELNAKKKSRSTAVLIPRVPRSVLTCLCVLWFSFFKRTNTILKLKTHSNLQDGSILSVWIRNCLLLSYTIPNVRLFVLSTEYLEKTNPHIFWFGCISVVLKCNEMFKFYMISGESLKWSVTLF